ncbi:MAG: hypothetical protein ABDH28_06310 [Brevinematia bacterium]
MGGKLVKWLLVVIVVGIWANMLRVSIPVLMEYFTYKEGQEHKIGVEGNFAESPGFYQKEVDINYIRNPFARVDKGESRVARGSKKPLSATQVSRSSTYSLFNLRGTLTVNNKMVAILEGRQDLGVSGTFYVAEGEEVMGEKIVEIGENYVIIFKDGEKITLYEVK